MIRQDPNAQDPNHPIETLIKETHLSSNVTYDTGLTTITEIVFKTIGSVAQSGNIVLKDESGRKRTIQITNAGVIHVL